MLSDNTEQIPILSSKQCDPEVCLSVTQILPFLDSLKLFSSPSCTFGKQSKKENSKILEVTAIDFFGLVWFVCFVLGFFFFFPFFPPCHLLQLDLCSRVHKVS